MLNKNIYNKYNKIINMDFYKQNNKEVFKIFLSLSKLHASSPKELLTVQDLAMFFYTQYPLVKSDEKVLIDTVFSKVDSVAIDDTLIANYLETSKAANAT